MLKQALFFGCFLLLATSGNAQCNLTPSIEGDDPLLLCPEQTTQLTTQPYDTYQWYKRFLSSSTAELIPGATSQSLTINAFEDVAYYFSVEVTLDTCSAVSPEILVDGWAFLPVTVANYGEYDFDGTNFILCGGDTMYFELLLPYDTNIVWTQDGSPIPGAGDVLLAVTEPGIYHVTAAPGVCPSYIQGLGVTLPVVVENCNPVFTAEITSLPGLQISPNPVLSRLTARSMSGDSIRSIQLYNAQGTLMWHQRYGQASVVELDLSAFLPGNYWLVAEVGSERLVKTIQVMR